MACRERQHSPGRVSLTIELPPCECRECRSSQLREEASVERAWSPPFLVVGVLPCLLAACFFSIFLPGFRRGFCGMVVPGPRRQGSAGGAMDGAM